MHCDIFTNNENDDNIEENKEKKKMIERQIVMAAVAILVRLIRK